MAFSWLGTNETPEKAPERQWLHGHQGVITWTRPKLEAFDKTYAQALEVNADKFKFEGYDFLTSYAKYLRDYLDTVLT